MAHILILYLSRNSGHHSAALAIDAALYQIEPSIKTSCVDFLEYLHPYLNKIIQRTYLVIIRRAPELWDALYDNERFEILTILYSPLLLCSLPPFLLPPF